MKGGKNMKENLLGFQLRNDPQSLIQWDIARRGKYLINENVDVPLSVDKSVWPINPNVPLLKELFAECYGGNYEDNIPNGLRLFSLKEESILNSLSYYNGGYLIGISIVNDDRDLNKRLLDMHRIEKKLHNIDLLTFYCWSCFGYDVADLWMISGLMNISFEPPKAEIAKKYSKDLNKFGLFDLAKKASNYCQECNQRIPEHAPFIVYGIWAKN